MKEYKVNGSVIEMVLESGKVVKCSTEWANRAMKSLETDMEDVLLMWLEDNDYLVNEEQEELDNKAKTNKVKLTATSEKVVKKTPKERVQKENEGIKEIILNTLTDIGKPVTITELQTANNELAEFSNQKISALLKQLVDSQVVDKMIDKKKSYFTVKSV